MKRAFTLTEMLYVLLLMAVAALMSARLFSASMRVISSAPKSQDEHAAIDRMYAALRNDAWSATKVELSDPQNVTLTESDGTVIRWRLGAADISRSTGRDKDEIRFSTPIRLRAEREGAWLVLHSDKPGDELRFASQMIASQGEN